MAKLLLFFALLLLATVVVNVYANPFHIQGRVYCDTCRCGFETSASTYISGARVGIECKDRNNLQLKYYKDGITDSTGAFNIIVEEDHQDQMCSAKLIDSPLPDCRTADPGRERSHIILTRSNGAVSNIHYSNALGFLKDKPLALCKELLKQYLPQDEYAL